MHYMKSENLWRETKPHNNKIKVVIITSAVTKITAGKNERWASRADFCGNGGFLASFYQRIPEFHSQLLFLPFIKFNGIIWIICIVINLRRSVSQKWVQLEEKWNIIFLLQLPLPKLIW